MRPAAPRASLWPFCEVCPRPPLRAVSRELGSVDEILGPLTEILEGVLQADQQLMEKTKAKVFSAFITVLQMKEMRGGGRWGPAGSGPSGLPAPAASRRGQSSLHFRARHFACEAWVFRRGTLVCWKTLSPPLPRDRTARPLLARRTPSGRPGMDSLVSGVTAPLPVCLQ